MRYLLAILIPPAALLTCRYYVSGLINGLLWVASFPAILIGFGFIGWAVCAIHAALMVGKFYSDRRAEEGLKILREAVQANGVSAAPALAKEGQVSALTDSIERLRATPAEPKAAEIEAKKERFGPDADGVYRID